MSGDLSHTLETLTLSDMRDMPIIEFLVEDDPAAVPDNVAAALPQQVAVVEPQQVAVAEPVHVAKDEVGQKSEHFLKNFKNRDEIRATSVRFFKKSQFGAKSRFLVLLTTLA